MSSPAGREFAAAAPEERGRQADRGGGFSGGAGQRIQKLIGQLKSHRSHARSFPQKHSPFFASEHTVLYQVEGKKSAMM